MDISLLMLSSLLCSVAADDVLDGLIGSFSPRFGPTHLDEPFDEARCDGCCESDSNGQEEGFVDGVCENGFCPYGTAVSTFGVGSIGGGGWGGVETDGFAKGGFEGANVVCSE